jgi:hypothetical protein
MEVAGRELRMLVSHCLDTWVVQGEKLHDILLRLRPKGRATNINKIAIEYHLNGYRDFLGYMYEVKRSTLWNDSGSENLRRS